MRKILIILVCCFAASLQAQSEYLLGNECYAAGSYSEAIEHYKTALQEGNSAEVYYNLGNTYFKQGELAQSILAYERALRINPQYEDAIHNLRFAQSRIIDNIEDNSTFFLSQWSVFLRNLLHENTWMWLSIGLFMLFLVGAIGFAFLRTIGWRKAFFHTGWIALVFAIICFAFASSLHSRDRLQNEAIITQSIVNAKSSPDKSGTDLFVLHEGSKVEIRSTLSGWAEITIGNHRGWVSLATLERI